jgi:NDP-sugar pyrophosphorylase family protein
MLPTVVILCGGRDTRLQEHTQLYASQGFADFVLCTGYFGEQVEALG